MPYPLFGYPAVYVDPDIVSFVPNPFIAEKGSSVSSVSLRWTLSKTPLSLALDGAALAPNTAQVNVIGPFTTDQTWKLQMGDEQRKVHKTTKLYFLNKVYSGFVTSAPDDSADILALQDANFASALKNRFLLGAPFGQVFCYAYPASFGRPRKVMQTIPTGLWQPPSITTTFSDYTLATVIFTNLSGFTEPYNVVTLNGPVAAPDGTVLEFV